MTLTATELLVKGYMTPKGNRAVMSIRGETSDHNTVYSAMTEDEYRLRDLDLGHGVALDVGSHIGSVAIGLAIDNQDARIVAVECLSENVALLRQNAEANGVSDRITIIHAAACRLGVTEALVKWNFDGESEAAAHHRFIANATNIPFDKAETEPVEGVSLDQIVDQHGPLDFCKIDCEGCEYEFLTSTSVRDVKLFRGEFHDGFERIVWMLADTHHVKRTSGTEAFGAFEAAVR